MTGLVPLFMEDAVWEEERLRHSFLILDMPPPLLLLLLLLLVGVVGVVGEDEPALLLLLLPVR